MILPGPLVLLGVSLGVAVLLQIFRPWTVITAWLGAATTTALGALLLLAPLDEVWRIGDFAVELGAPLVVLGRPLVIGPSDQLALAFLFFTTAGLFILGWRLLPHSNFFPIGLATVALLAAALMVEQVVYAALFVEMAAILSIFPLHEPTLHVNGDAPSAALAAGGVRYMAYATLALPGLMITQLLLDLFEIFPNDLGLLNTSSILLSLSFAILFGAVPFQNWLSAVATDGSPPVLTFIFTINLGTVWFMLLDYLQAYPWLGQQVPIGQLFTDLGLVMMVTGGMLAASQRRLGRLVGYATLVDNGAMLLALGTRRQEGVALAVLMLLARPFALGLMTLGLQGLRRLQGDDRHAALEGAAWRVPWRAAAFVIGGVSMAGFPISLSFAARWGLYRLVADSGLFVALLALAGSAGVMLGLVRTMRVLLTSLRDERTLPITMAEDRVILVLIILLTGATFFLGLFPQAFSRVALEIASWYTFFS